jgi:hypothetical protein
VMKQNDVIVIFCHANVFFHTRARLCVAEAILAPTCGTACHGAPAAVEW